MAHGKRSHDEYDEDNHFSMGQTLSKLNGNSEPFHPATTANGAEGKKKDASGDWQTAESRASKKRKKLPKKEGDNYPTVTHSANARLQSFVKISDLQNLALYMIADGNGPQWCAVKHHGQVRRVVTLMVPGLEAGLFDGSIPLSMSKEGEEVVLGADEIAAPASSSAQQDSNGNAHDTPDTSTSPAQPRRLNISPDDYYPTKLVTSRLPAPLQPLGEIFDHIWPVKTPGDDRHAKMHSPLAAMLIAQIVKPKEDKKSKGPQPPFEGRGWRNQRTPVTELLATREELVDDGYVLHPAHYNGTKLEAAETARRTNSGTSTADGWVDTADIPDLKAGNAADKDNEQGSITAGRHMLAMDCEMCLTSLPGSSPQIFSLTRVSLIDWDGKTVLDELVKPDDPITDYLTPYSGITAAMLQNVTTTLSDIQTKLLSIITPQTILIGHSLNSDLNALKMTHPFIIDTALLFPHPRGPPLKSSLKWLSQKYLSREIQKGHGSVGHDSVEDASACLDLVKQKCEKGKAWGTSEASNESIFKRLARSHRPRRDKVNPIGEEEPRLGAVVDWGEPLRGYGAQAKVAIGCESDAEIVAGIKRVLATNSDEEDIPKGGCDYIWARFRELEAYRGWWNKSKLVDTDALRSSTAQDSADASLSSVLEQTVQHVQQVYDALPPCTAFIIYSGSGDPRELSEMQALHQRFRDEYKTMKWDQLSVRWTDEEEQKLRRACEKARRGVGFVTVK